MKPESAAVVVWTGEPDCTTVSVSAPVSGVVAGVEANTVAQSWATS